MKNPPAFPLHNHGTQTLGLHLTGMTLRDYFAAKAMAAIILREGKEQFVVDEITTTAYQYADAMLKAREQ